MSFSEKSAWVMFLVLAVIGGGFIIDVVEVSLAIGAIAPPMMVIKFVVSMIFVSIVAQVVLAITSSRDASRPKDERERSIALWSSAKAGFVFAFGVITSLGHFLYYGDGNLLFYMVLASLIMSQLLEYVLQIIAFRRGI